VFSCNSIVHQQNKAGTVTSAVQQHLETPLVTKLHILNKNIMIKI
jgi:hypothetical protein